MGHNFLRLGQSALKKKADELRFERLQGLAQDVLHKRVLLFPNQLFESEIFAALKFLCEEVQRNNARARSTLWALQQSPDLAILRDFLSNVRETVFPELKKCLSAINYRLQDFHAAIALSGEYYETNPSDLRGAFLHASFLNHFGRDDEAKNLLLGMIQITPETEDQARYIATAYDRLAFLEERKSSLDKAAIQNFRREATALANEWQLTDILVEQKAKSSLLDPDFRDLALNQRQGVETVLYEEAENHCEEGKFELARAKLNVLIKQAEAEQNHLQQQTYHRLMSKIYKLEKNGRKAIEHVEKAIKLADIANCIPGALACRFMLSEYLTTTKDFDGFFDFDRAVTLLKDAIGIAERNRLSKDAAFLSEHLQCLIDADNAWKLKEAEDFLNNTRWDFSPDAVWSFANKHPELKYSLAQALETAAKSAKPEDRGQWLLQYLIRVAVGRGGVDDIPKEDAMLILQGTAKFQEDKSQCKKG